MGIIALLTDFGVSDGYAGIMKGVILKINPKAVIVDITHHVSSYNIKSAAFILKSVFKYFERDSVFTVVVDPGVGSGRLPVAVKTKNYYFVGPDNGVLSLAAEEDKIERVIALNNNNFFLKEISSTFHGRDIFSPCAALLSKGFKIDLLGEKVETIVQLKLPAAEIRNNALRGKVIYTDKFGNLVTNIENRVFWDFIKNGEFISSVNGINIREKVSSYSRGGEKKAFFIEGSCGYMEISLKENSAARHFSIGKNMPSVIVRKKTKTTKAKVRGSRA